MPEAEPVKSLAPLTDALAICRELGCQPGDLLGYEAG